MENVWAKVFLSFLHVSHKHPFRSQSPSLIFFLHFKLIHLFSCFIRGRFSPPLLSETFPKQVLFSYHNAKDSLIYLFSCADCVDSGKKREIHFCFNPYWFRLHFTENSRWILKSNRMNKIFTWRSEEEPVVLSRWLDSLKGDCCVFNSMWSEVFAGTLVLVSLTSDFVED